MICCLYQQELKKELGYKPAKVEKLVPNLWPKQKYVIHYQKSKNVPLLEDETSKDPPSVTIQAASLA